VRDLDFGARWGGLAIPSATVDPIDAALIAGGISVVSFAFNA
jgi:hypothetical protein